MGVVSIRAGGRSRSVDLDLQLLQSITLPVPDERLEPQHSPGAS